MKLFIPLFIITILMGCHNNPDTTATATTSILKNDTSWIGDWKRSDWANEGVLTITNINNDSINFSLDASSGGHTGNLDSVIAVVDSNHAKFYSADEDDTCMVTFKRYGDSLIVVEQVTGMCFTAMGVDYSGNYYNTKYKKDSVIETLSTLGILNPTQDAIFKVLTKKDYDLFLNSTQLTNNDDSDLDNLNCKVQSSGIRGLFTEMENIIMIDSANNIWAAAIDDGGEKEKVFYFTNSNRFKDSLPKTIENWMSNFKDYPVVYKR